ncbi:MAG: hypothetical protein NZ561_12770, partial [Phycisphaerae bacterium]|nr:hypothetical protein [Phycisphaerae bacterium]MDW8262873.1 hypothetical protein [Phycisphaerales bacterium]
MPQLPLELETCEHRLNLHGLAVRVTCQVPELNWPLHAALGEFTTADWPEGFQPLPGLIQPYEESVVLRHLCPDARPLPAGDELIDLYEHGDRFWLVDDRWGLCEIDLLKRNWTSWIIPQPRLNRREVVEAAVLWPLAQLLPSRGLTLVPAVGLSRGGLGVLIISPFGIEPELSVLLEAGWSLIGSRWTALREEDGRVAMLHLPGGLEPCEGS